MKRFGGFYQRPGLIWIERGLKSWGRKEIIGVKGKAEAFYKKLRWYRKIR